MTKAEQVTQLFKVRGSLSHPHGLEEALVVHQPYPGMVLSTLKKLWTSQNMPSHLLNGLDTLKSLLNKSPGRSLDCIANIFHH